MTVDLDIDLGFYVHHHARIRVADVDAPEMKTPEGRAATLWAMTLLGAQPYLTVRTELDRTFDRFVGWLSLPDGSDYGQRLVESGHAVRRTA